MPTSRVTAILFALTLATASASAHPHPPFRLNYTVSVTSAPVGATQVGVSSKGTGRLYNLDNSEAKYTSPVQMITLSGSPSEVGEAYGELYVTPASTAPETNASPYRMPLHITRCLATTTLCFVPWHRKSNYNLQPRITDRRDVQRLFRGPSADEDV